MSKKKQEPSVGKGAASQQWADSVLMSDKPDKTGIELRFNAEPSPELQPKLRAMGFNLSRTQNKWYGSLTDANRQFVADLQEQLSTTVEGPVLFFTPSVEALRANVEKKDYSIVLITLKSGEGKHFLLFEPSKSKAEVIARQFAKSNFGDDFQTLMVTPRQNLKVARVLFDEGKIIAKATQVFTPEKQQASEQTITEEMKQTPQAPGKISLKEILLTTVTQHFDPQFEMGERFTSFKASDDFILPLLGKFSNVHFKVIWADGSSHSGMMDLEPAEFFKGRDNLLSTNMQNYCKVLSSQSPNAVYSKAEIEIAKTRLRDYLLEDTVEILSADTDKDNEQQQKSQQALAEVQGLLQDGLITTLKKRNDHYLTEDSPGDIRDRLLREFHHWAPQQEGFVSFGDDSIKAFLDKWLNENQPELTVQEKEKFWQAHLSIWKQLDLLKKIRKPPSMFEPYCGNFKRLLKIIPDLIHHIKRGVRAGKSVVSPKGGLMDLHFDYLYKDKEGRYVIALSHYYQQEGDAMKDPDMQLRVDPQMQTAEALTFEQSYPPKYQYVYKEQDGKTLVNSSLKKDLNSFLRTWLLNLLHQGHKVDLTNAEVAIDEVAHPELKESNAISGTPEYDKLGFTLIQKFIPGLVPYLEGKAEGSKQEILAEFNSGDRKVILGFNWRKENECEISFHEDLDGEEELQNEILISLDKHEATVSSEWLSDRYAERFDRLKSEEELDDIETYEGEDMNRGFCEWMEELTPLGTMLLSKINPASNQELPADWPVYDALVMARFIESDSFLSSRWADKKNIKALKGDTFTKEQEKELKAFFQVFVNEDVEMGKKYRLVYLSLKGETTETKRKEEALAKPSKSLSYATNGKNHACFLPNILIPNGVVEPCISKHFEPFDMGALIHSDFKQFEKLRDTDIKTLRPTDLFVLLQLSASTEAGLKFNRAALLKEFQERGQELFEQLGYPTDPLYPYASVVMGYEMIEALGDIIKVKPGEKQNWPFAAGSYRPIADLKKALDYFRVDIGNHQRTLEKINKGDSNKTRSDTDTKQLSNKLQHSIDNLGQSARVIEKYLKERESLSQEMAVTEKEGEQSGQSHPTDIVDGDETVLINVLVPDQLHEPFLSMHLFEEDKAAEIAKAAPGLKRLNDDNLSTASPLELLQLLKLTHPTEYGINVGRGSVLSEWSRRGHELFVALGYPTDPAYPYVNLYRGYLSIDPLEQILWDNNRQGDEWWSAAENYFPVANMQKALDLIAGLENKARSEQSAYLNPKTKKAKSEFREQSRDIEFQLKDLQEARSVIFSYQEAVNDVAKKTIQDPLTNESGVYTKQTAGNNLEILTVPIPKSAQVRVEIQVVKTSSGSYTYGNNVAKLFGDSNGVGYSPSIHDPIYLSRMDALHHAFSDVESLLKQFLKNEDSILNNEEKKNKNIRLALQSLYQFAKVQGVDLQQAQESALPSANSSTKEIIRGLEKAYWTKEDYQYPVDKVMIHGAAMHQARLREIIKGKILKYPSASMSLFADELATRFKERRPLESYQEGLVKREKLKDKREGLALADYVDDMIIDNDLGNPEVPLLNYLVETLFDLSEKLVDLPQAAPVQTLQPEKKMNQHELNKAIEAFVDNHDLQGLSYSAEDKNYIRQYSGSGGLLKQGASGRGVLYEYYTPDLVVQKMWGLVTKYGYDGGPILEPSVGIGNFLKYAPKGATITGYETNSYSARIAQALYPSAKIIIGAFETIFFARNVHLKNAFNFPPQSLVIGNPPYGEFTGKYAGMGEKAFTGALEYDQYFILRGLDLLKPGGLLCFIIPSSFLDNNHKSEKVKEKIAQKAELVDAYRLPIRTFETTDIGTDIVLLKRI